MALVVARSSQGDSAERWSQSCSHFQIPPGGQHEETEMRVIGDEETVALCCLAVAALNAWDEVEEMGTIYLGYTRSKRNIRLTF